MELLQQASVEEPQAKKQLWKFQEYLSQVPEWNVDKVQREVQKLVGEIQCDYLEELITAVFIAHTKVLTAIRVGNKNKRVQITIPKIDHFLHRALSESSRLLWSSAYLFNNEISPIEKQKNHRQVEQLLHDGIAQAIRGLLPVKSILKDYLAEPEDDEEEEEEEKEKEKDTAIHEEKKVEEEVIVKEEAKPEEVKEEAITEEIKPEPEAEKVIVTEPAPEPVSAPAEPTLSEPIAEPVTPRLVVETEPSVRFTDFDQVIQQRGDKTHIDYVEKDRNQQEAEDNEEFEFVDDDGESLSDFEEIDIDERNKMEDDDYEVLP
jgi:hypothetical protein